MIFLNVIKSVPLLMMWNKMYILYIIAYDCRELLS